MKKRERSREGRIKELRLYMYTCTTVCTELPRSHTNKLSHSPTAILARVLASSGAMTNTSAHFLN